VVGKVSENSMKFVEISLMMWCRWRGAPVAIKTLKESLSGKQLEDFKAEAAVMVRLRPHVNVVQVIR
jgi:hypothetical protein